MNTFEARKTFSLRYPTALLVLLIFGCSGASAQKKTSTTPTPAPKVSAPVKSAPPVSKPGGGGATHEATTAAGHASTSSSGHGITTSNAGHGITTSNAGHGITTSNAGHAPTSTAGHGETTSTAGHGETTSTAGHGGITSTAGHRETTSTAGHGAGTTTTVGHSSTTKGTNGYSGAGTKGASTTSPHALPVGHKVARAPNGSEVRTRPNGKIAEVHDAKRGMEIHHGLTGRTRVVTERPGGTRIVAERGGRSYVQHSFAYQGHEYVSRSYYYNNTVYSSYYGNYYYHGVYVNYYTPGYYYPPAYYGWAYNPWVAPVPYAWGWGGNPWYGYYGGYFTPYPVYPSASIWLTDYLVSTTLAAAYQAHEAAVAQAQAQAEAPAPAADAAPLTPEVKDLIAAEVQRQIALENAEAATKATDSASSSVQRLLSDNVKHIFLSGSDIDVVNADGAECAISEGDALQLSGPAPADTAEVSLVVLSSKGGQECKRGVSVSVKIADLQDMQNHMRETIDKGLGEMKNNKSLPAVPVSASGEPVKANFMSTAPPADANAPTEINQQLQSSDQAEKETVAEAQTDSGAGQVAQANTPPPPPAEPVQISMGMSIDEVTRALGQPVRIVDLGSKKIYVYKDMKITFKEGKVSDVQ